MASYDIVLAEDYLPLRQIIKNIVEETGELTVVGEANDGEEVLAILELSLPDMVITDIKLGGLKASLKIKELYPRIKVIILTVHMEKDYLNHAMINGVDGYILKQDMDQELYSGIQAVRRGEVYISHSMNPTP
ncbi:MAG: response regulator transcription factor [Desulfobaccales bacterium]